MKDLKNDLKTGDLQKAYLLFGEESFLVEYYVKQLVDHGLTEEEKSMNLDVVNGNKESVHKIIDALDTQPFFAERRLVLVKDSALFETGRKQDTETLAEYISAMDDVNMVVFQEKKVDKRNKLYKCMQKAGRCVECKEQTEKELVKWIQNICKKERLTIAADDAQYLVAAVGNDMQQLYNETAKIISYLNEETVITKAHIDALATKNIQARIFDLVDAIGRKDAKNALVLYNSLLQLKEQPIMILSMIARQFRLILQCAYLAGKGFSSAQIAQQLSLRSFIVSNCLRQSKHFSHTQLEKALADCLQADLDIKTGKLQGEMAVQLLIVQYSHG